MEDTWTKDRCVHMEMKIGLVDILMFGHFDTWTCGQLDIWTYGHVNLLTSEHLDIMMWKRFRLKRGGR